MVVWIVCLTGLVMMLIEQCAPGRVLPEVRGFHLRALAASGVQALIAFVAGVAWDGALARARPWSADALGVVPGAIVGYLVITLVYYGWHRARHEVPFLWRWVHQLHHSPSRIEVITSFYKHPLEILLNGLLSSAIVYLVVGLSREAATLAVLLTGLAELFYHWNVRTPRWVGFFVQRPEMHQIHHERGRHACNYGDLPIWDMLFGTYANPERFEGECGFDPAREQRAWDMLRARDVHATDAARDVRAEDA